MSEVIQAANKGLPVLGICNGFQILVEAGLLPGGLVRNNHGDFICRDQKLRVESTQTVWTSDYSQAQEITIPLKNGEGGFIADAETLKRIEDENLVVFRYLDVNPNGSLHDIAGLRDPTGRIVGLMPHPEHAVEPGFGPDTGTAMKSGIDGLAMFTSAVKSVISA
jgi:phosphoribosylformylglycinamidine synthase